MDTHSAVVQRIKSLMKEHDWNEHQLSLDAAVPQKTINSIFHDKSKNTGIITIKKICDSFGITLGEFFSSPEFD